MPLGPFGEVLGTTGTLEALGPLAQNYKTKVVAPRNPKVVKERNVTEFKMTPSKFLFEASLTTEQKLANTRVMKIPRKTELLDMGDTSLQKISKVNIDEPMFQPFPSEIFFQNFEPFQTYEIPLVLRNNDKVPRLVKVSQENSPYFKIISPHDVGHKVGPGLPTIFKVHFTPDEKKDYRHELICITEREKFVVPIKAIGARGILDFPDAIHFPTCPVKYSSTKTLLVRNIGKKEAKFHIKSKQPFFVVPAIGTLAVNDCIQVTIEFKPLTAGDHRGEICLTYDTGEEIFIDLYGASQDANVRLDKNSIRMENTYISMASQRTVVISNRSDFIAHFKWSRFATQDDEDQEKLLKQIQLDREEHADTDQFLAECVADPTLRDKLSILSRTFQNRKKAVENDPHLFEDDIITIEPAEGDIWPNSTFEVMVIFKPREATSYTITAYCDITGRESRLPLRIRGDGLGPKVDFSFEQLDMGNIFIGSRHTYEIVIANKGDIDAIFSVVPKTTIFGPCFAFNPSEGIVMPGGHQAIEVSFNSPYLGDFEEIFCFQVDGQPQQCPITFRGKVVGPTFNFDVSKLKFGKVPVGFTSTQVCTLVNTSLVPMVFHLRVPGDGKNKAICCTNDLSKDTMFLGMPVQNPKEFEIMPSDGVVSPHGHVKLTVNLVPNTIRKFEMALVVDVERVGEEILSLPISATSMVPEISNLTPILNYGRCFLRYPYEHFVQLHNDTDLAARYDLLPQSYKNKETSLVEIPPISYHSPQPKGIIEPHTVVDIPLVIEALDLEEQEMPLEIRIFGSPKPPLVIHVICVGEGPVVHVNPLQIDWGETPVLTNVAKTLVLSNESYIPALFTAHMVRPNTVFKVTPSEGTIAPEQSIELTITANLDDCVRFQDKLQINFQQSQSRLIPLSAFGKGTTIVSEPPLGDVLDLGPNFSNCKLKKKLKLINRGRRIQQLVWLTDGFIPLSKAKKEKMKAVNMDMKRKTASLCDVAEPIFQLSPNRMELLPGESLELTLEGFVNSPQLVSETIVCHAIIGRAGGKTPIISVDVRAEFIEPLLNFSTKCVFYRVDKGPADELPTMQQQLVITNQSSLSLTTKLKLGNPFSMVIGNEKVQETEVCLQPGDIYYLVIEFDPKFKDDCHIRTIDEVLQVTYMEHPHIDYIALHGEVYFPNLLFEKNTVDFGCILNDTEVTRYINITNNSPMEVCYRWSFLVGDIPTNIKKMHRPQTCRSDRMIEPGYESDSGLEEDEELVNQDEFLDHSDQEDKYVERKDSKVQESEMKIIHKEALDETDGQKSKEAVDNKTVMSPADFETPEKGQLDQEEKMEKDKEQGRITSRLSVKSGEKETDKRSINSRLSLREDEEEALKANKILTALLETDEDIVPEIGVEEVFDILPLYGCLQPGDTEQVTFTFYGHADIWGEVKAICEVEGGPTYELSMTGEASVVEYSFDSNSIQLGKQMYDQVSTATITLINCGKVGFQFSGINMDPALQKRPLPGQPIILPHSGYIEPFAEQKILVKYLPGVPEDFCKTFQIQVAHFEPDAITISGEGVFPRISLDLPRIKDEEGVYLKLLKEAKENLAALIQQQLEKQQEQEAGQVEEELRNLIPDGEEMHEHDKTANNSHNLMREPTELEVQMEIERLAMRDFAREHHLSKLASASVDDKGENIISTFESNTTVEQSEVGKLKAILPDYLLDFGYVVLGTVKTHVVRVTNTGWMPVSFKLDRQNIHTAGFHIELDRVRNLPGAPDNETLDFVVMFDPRGANLHLGALEVVVPINVVHGPIIKMRLRANVTMPDLEVSDDVLDFADVKCGECKVITIQLHNHQMVKCEWNSIPPDESKKIDKHVPMHLRRKIRQNKKKASIFEVMPPTGTLMPGQRVNVQVKFMPTEEKFYENRLPIRIAQSSQRILLLCRGQGLEPRLEFDRTVVQFGPILPHSVGDEQDIVVRNPCSFPIEMYSLEFDNVYLEEEKILRLMKGYDEFNTLLLPPRDVGSKLPQELTDYFEEQVRKLEESERAAAFELVRQETERREMEEREAEEKALGQTEEEESMMLESNTIVSERVVSGTEAAVEEPQVKVVEEPSAQKDAEIEDKLHARTSSFGVGELEITPVSAAIARYLGIDLTPEGKASRNRRGISLIVHGAPLSGKTGTAVALAKHYEAALLTLDGIVCDAIANGNTSAGLKARELCLDSAKKKTDDVREAEGTDLDKKAGLSVEQVTAHTQGAAGTAGTSLGSNRKTSTVMVDQKNKQTVVSKNTAVNSSTEGGAAAPISPVPILAPAPRRLSISASIAGEEGLFSCILPEDLLVEIIADRLQLNDCHKGIVFDGLETSFAQNYFTAAHAVLKALNNRRFIYFVTLKMDYNVLKEQEKKAHEEKELETRQKEEAELIWLEEMDEDEYDNLPEEVKARIDYKRLVLKKERIKREQQEKAERERIERELREEEERRREEEMKTRKNRKKADKKASTLVRSPAAAANKTPGGLKVHDAEKPPGTDRPESHATVKSDPQLDEGKKKRKGGKKGEHGENSTLEDTRDLNKEADMLLMSKFRTFETYQKDIQDLLEFWDRTTLQPRRPNSPSDKSEEDHKEFSASGKKGKQKAPSGIDEDKTDKQKEQERLKHEKEMAEKAAREAALVESDQKDGADKDDKKDVNNIPHIIVDCAEKKIVVITKPVVESQTTVESHSNEDQAKKMVQHKGSSHSSIKLDLVAAVEGKGRRRSTVLKKSTASLKELKGDRNKNTNSNLTVQHVITTKEIDRIMSKLFPEPVPVLVKPTFTTYDHLILESGRLPAKEEVMDGLGMGQHGPPIPPAATFAVIPYPVKRKPPALPEAGGRYIFMSSSPDDPNLGPEVKPKEAELEEELAPTPDKLKEDVKGKGSKAVTDKGRTSSDRKKSADRKKLSRRNSVVPSVSPDGTNVGLDVEVSRQGTQTTTLENVPSKPITVFRWIIPAGGNVTLKLRFLSDDLGQFDQTMNFEIIGTRRRYQMFCRGICAFPTISKEPRIVFPSRKKNHRIEDIVHKKYILSTEVFEFGPLLVGKSRDKYREGKYPENMETITILNTSPLDADISFCFQHDSKGETYLLEPPFMYLKPGEAGKLTVWAYPKVKHNAENSVGLNKLVDLDVEKSEVSEDNEEVVTVVSNKSVRGVRGSIKQSITLMEINEEEHPGTAENHSVPKLAASFEEWSRRRDTLLHDKKMSASKHRNSVRPVSSAPSWPGLAAATRDKSRLITTKPSPGHYEDAIVCCIRENPEPVIFKVSCDGYRPELELDKKILHFDKVLLHRKDTKTIYLRNSTQLPVAWKLSGLENLGDDFTVAADSGIVEPLSEYALHAYFRAMKAVQTNKKMIRIEISDAENIMGVVHTEPIQVIAEAYDVALDMSFPKGSRPAGHATSSEDEKLITLNGPTSSQVEIMDVFIPERKGKKGRGAESTEPIKTVTIDGHKVKGKPVGDPLPTFSLMGGKGTDGGLDFGIVKVGDEGKQTCTLKNKGKYEIAYNFLLENVDTRHSDIKSLFAVVPSSGKLNPQDRPTQVQVIFKSSHEVQVKDIPILKCQVIEPSLGDQGEVIASIPVKVSVKAVYSKFLIAPVNDINFGALLINTRKTRTFLIENKGQFDFKYTITKKETATHANRNIRPNIKGDKSIKAREDSSTPTSKQKRVESIRQDPSLSKLTLGMFTIFPAFGIILPNGSQLITVDCVGETQGKEVQDMSIEISDRDPNSYKGGIPYKLVAETCIPGINVDDVGSIFEEHRVCKNLTIWQHMSCGNQDVGGAYGEEEKKFVFNNVIVGRTAKARFKISNHNKVPCDVAFTLRPISLKGAPKTPEVFDLDPPKVQIANHSFVYVTVSFTPPSMQSYSAVFEASIEGMSPNQTKGKSLVFEVSGEGNLPRITVAKPTVRNKRGQPLLLFKRILLGRSDSLPFELFNDGNLPSKVMIDLHDPDHCFMLKPLKEPRNAFGDTSSDTQEIKRAHASSVVVNHSERATFEVTYLPHASIRSQANLKVTVIDNQYEDYIIQMVGEGYQDDITLDNIGSVNQSIEPEKEPGSMADDDIEAHVIEEDGDKPSSMALSEDAFQTFADESETTYFAAKCNVMNFGDCYPNSSRTLSLTMSNHSKTDCVRFQWPDHADLTFSPQVGHLHANCTKDIAVSFISKAPQSFSQVPIQCRILKIRFDKPIDSICDWDDKIQVVKWVDNVPTSAHNSPQIDRQVPKEKSSKNLSAMEDILEVLLFGSKSVAIGGQAKPTKKKVIETEPEPQYIEVPDTARDVELLISAVSDYPAIACDAESVHFKNTPMFQTRVYSVTLHNEGKVALSYNWQVILDSLTPTIRRSVTFMSDGDRPESRVDILETSYSPFFVEPEFGTIPVGKNVSCMVKFAPLDASDYEGRLICSVPNVNKEFQNPVIGLKARSLMPYCHFELEDSDYKSCGVRDTTNSTQQGLSLDPSTKIIEFSVCGVGVKCCKEFGIINPTNETFHFEWLCEDDNDPKHPTNFRCLNASGKIKGGRKYKVAFEFTSNKLDVVESSWRFNIPAKAISIPFLLVGHTREPVICMDRSHLNFKALLVGREAKETIYLNNNEDIPFNFSFVEESCYTEGYSSQLKVEPMSGQLDPKSSIAINLYFSPKSEKEVNFNLRCNIQHKKTPITLNVKAEGYQMNSILLCEDSTGNRVELSDRGINQINFGEVEINENVIRHLFLLNTGNFNFDFQSEFSTKSTGAEAITLTPSMGSAMSGETKEMSLAFCPQKKMSVKNCEFSIKVTNGPTYNLSVTGHSVNPGLVFSFRTYNFGNNFIQKTGLNLPKNQAILKLTNKDKKEVSVDCMYAPTSQLSYKFEACVIAPGKTVKVPFTFTPTQPIKYHETVVFEINGLSKQKVELFGAGHEMKIEVADPKHKCINLGSKMVGDSVRKFIPIVNNSPVSLTFNLAFTPTEPGLQQKEVLSITPKEQITLEANVGTTKVEVWFRPKARIPQFTEEVLMECSGISQPLFVVKGSCLGMEISLDSDYLAFGTVFQRSSSTRKLVMSNTGDMSSKFRWDIKQFKPDFSITPVEGYITPGMDVTFDVEFHPQNVSGDVRYDKLKCSLDGGPHKPLTLTLTGSCTGIPPVKEVQNFQCVVREKETRQLMIPNKSNQTWNLKPIIDGEYWTGPVTFLVEPQQSSAYPLTYEPLAMTTENKKHTGSIFFPLPDGSGLLFNLQGSAEPPKVIAKIQRDVPCKTGYTELLPVYNWLKKPQRFRVKTESLKSEKLDGGTIVKGVEYIDVPAKGSKDYKLSFHAHKEGVTMIKITFINEQTGEYQFYEVTFKATRPGTISTINLSTPVRQIVPYTLTLDNPLSSQVTFSTSCSVPEVLIPNQLVVPASSQGHFSFEYQPLKVGEVSGRLELTCTELGQFTYDLNFIATPAPPEKPIYFRTGLGTNVTQVAKFFNFAKQKTDYTCKIDNTDFHVEKSVAAAPGSTGGTEVVLDVMFEPSTLGEQLATLSVSSPQGGDYTFPLIATCIPPKPQGPYTVKSGTTTPIMFRNVFNAATQFVFQVDNPLFHLTKQGETIRAKKDHRIVVGFDGQDTSSPVMGKLIVSCAKSAGGSSNAQWVFYLKGVSS